MEMNAEKALMLAGEPYLASDPSSSRSVGTPGG